MKVAVVRGGGIAGVVQRTELASSALDAHDTAELQRRVRDSGVLAAAPEPSAPARGADRLRYSVAVDEDGEQRVAHFDEESLPEGVRELIEWVGAHPQAEHEVQRPG